MYDVDSVLTKQFNVFDSYGVSEYLYLHNLAVDERFRGLNIGLQSLEARFESMLLPNFLHFLIECFCESCSKKFCQESNIKLMHGIFSSDFSTRMADEFGFKLDLAIR